MTQLRVLGRTKSVTTVVDWTKPPRPFLLKRKNLQRSPMRQLWNWGNNLRGRQWGEKRRTGRELRKGKQEVECC